MPTKLSPNFTLEELVATVHRDKDNTPPPNILRRLPRLAANMEAIRHALGNKVVTVSSGYRSPALNALVGGTPGSAHVFGYACDFNCYGFGDPLSICHYLVEHRASFDLAWDQLIEEGSWVHISFAPALRGEVLTKNPAGGYFEGLPPAKEPAS